MKIAYWSPVHGQGKTTSNLVITSILSNILFHYNTIVLDTNFYRADLQRYFLGVNSDVIGEYFAGDVGIDAISRNMKMEELTKESIDNCAITLRKEGLHLIPPTVKLYEELYEERLIPVLSDIIESLDKNYDVTFIDTNSGTKNHITNQVLSMSDIIVVNLPQNPLVIEDYFKELPLKEYEQKLMYCIGSYSSRSAFNVFNIKKMNRLHRSTPIFCIPYNVKYMDRVGRGKGLNYVEELLDEKGDIEDRYFFEESKKAMGLIIKKMKLSGGKYTW